jgi:hypothetical protein
MSLITRWKSMFSAKPTSTDVPVLPYEVYCNIRELMCVGLELPSMEFYDKYLVQFKYTDTFSLGYQLRLIRKYTDRVMDTTASNDLYVPLSVSGPEAFVWLQHYHGTTLDMDQLDDQYLSRYISENKGTVIQTIRKITPRSARIVCVVSGEGAGTIYHSAGTMGTKIPRVYPPRNGRHITFTYKEAIRCLDEFNTDAPFEIPTVEYQQILTEIHKIYGTVISGAMGGEVDHDGISAAIGVLNRINNRLYRSH